MKWFYNLRTRTKLFVSFGLLALLLAGIGLYSLFNLQQSNDDLKLLYDNNLTSVQNLSQAQILYQRTRVNVRD